MYQLTLISDDSTMEIPRDRYLDRLVARKHNGMVKIITGVHGCGKSYLLFDLFREHLVRSGVEDPTSSPSPWIPKRTRSIAT